MPHISLAMVILHYGKPDLARRLRDQLAASDPDWAVRLWVLDNAAPRPFAGAWRRNAQNLYWAGALDQLLGELPGLGFTHLWYLNNDIEFLCEPPILARALARLERLEEKLGPVGLYSPAALRNPYHPQMVADPRFQYRATPLVDGIAPLLRLEAVRDAGGLDCADNPYGYGVDLWLSLRLDRAGWPVVVDHQVALRHRYHTTARSAPGFMDAASVAEAAYLARRLGQGYREELARLKAGFRDEERLG
jgi:GT2 family glycosyltransferase